MDPKDYDMYQMTESRQKDLWSDCVFVFDTSALLALYLYPEDARQQIYKEIFEKIKGRLWIPHHVKFEYFKNRASKIREPISKNYMPLKDDYIKPIIDSFNKSLNRVDALKNNIKNADNHPHIVSEELEKYEVKLKEFLKTTIEFEKAFDEQMGQKINEILLLEQNDTVSENIQRYFKVGREYTYDEILKITMEGKHRYEFKIPPGYEDLKDKIGTQIFGDLIIWKQILEYSKENKKNIVFICNDVKEDWWHLLNAKKGDKKRTNGPRKELIKEIMDHSGSAFWMYNQAKFLDIANTLIKSNILNRHIEQASRFVISKTLDKSLVYTCGTCGNEGMIDTATLHLNFEAVGTGTGKSTGIENRYLAAAGFNCGHCENVIKALFEVWEYPLGVINHQQIIFKGAALIKENPVEEDSLFDEYENYAEEEIFIIDKKQVRLKACKARKIKFGKIVEGNDTLFELEQIKPEDKHLNKRLQVEAFNDQKKKITKTLVLENGVTRFVMRTDEENFNPDFLYINLTANIDMTIILSAIEYPGTGRYLDKLYY
jgi:hypothetical protein